MTRNILKRILMSAVVNHLAEIGKRLEIGDETVADIRARLYQGECPDDLANIAESYALRDAGTLAVRGVVDSYKVPLDPEGEIVVTVQVNNSRLAAQSLAEMQRDTVDIRGAQLPLFDDNGSDRDDLEYIATRAQGEAEELSSAAMAAIDGMHRASGTTMEVSVNGKSYGTGADAVKRAATDVAKGLV